MATFVVTGDQGNRISNKLAEIQRQVFLQKEYKYDPELLIKHLQDATEGRFVLPTKEKQMEVSPPSLFKTADTDLDYWLNQTEVFTEKYLGVKINLRERFVIPQELPWPSAIPVFDPGNLTNRDMVNMLKKQNLNVWEEVDVMEYDGAEANSEPTLHLIENSIRPNADTMGLSLDQLNEMGQSFLRLRGYGLAFAIRYFAQKDYLDPKTWTWFPKDTLPDGHVAYGRWDPSFRQVWFDWDYPDHRHPSLGARSAISVSLNP